MTAQAITVCRPVSCRDISVASAKAMISFATRVPSIPHTGQATRPGIRPQTGSMSKT